MFRCTLYFSWYCFLFLLGLAFLISVANESVIKSRVKFLNGKNFKTRVTVLWNFLQDIWTSYLKAEVHKSAVAHKELIKSFIHTLSIYVYSRLELGNHVCVRVWRDSFIGERRIERLKIRCVVESTVYHIWSDKHWTLPPSFCHQYTCTQFHLIEYSSEIIPEMKHNIHQLNWRHKMGVP